MLTLIADLVLVHFLVTLGKPFHLENFFLLASVRKKFIFDPAPVTISVISMERVTRIISDEMCSLDPTIS